MFQTLKVLPATLLWIEGEQIGVLAFGGAAMVWLMVPFIDRNPEGRSGRLWIAVGILAIIYIIAMTAWGVA
jgi:quinol-cytochrome oxidoreductase complex cytochrome b subunit